MHPYLLDSDEMGGSSPTEQGAMLSRSVADVTAWLSRLDVLVVGPGLGRDEAVLSAAEALVRPRGCAPRGSACRDRLHDAHAGVRCP